MLASFSGRERLSYIFPYGQWTFLHFSNVIIYKYIGICKKEEIIYNVDYMKKDGRLFRLVNRFKFLKGGIVANHV